MRRNHWTKSHLKVGKLYIEEESQFEQSILFNKNNRREKNGNDAAFIDKIE
jgi:hypothetical protein